MKADYLQHDYVDPILRELLHYIELRYGFEFTQTSGYRINDSGVHGTLPLRGWDLRCWDYDVGMLIAKQVSSVWQYDYKRPELPCVKYHKTKNGGWHLHVQVHQSTKRLDG